MMKKLIFALFAIAIVFLAGCGGGDDIDTSAADSPYEGGTKGVISNFEDMGVYSEDSGTNEIFEGESFPIEITVRNKGEYELAASDVRVKITGIALSDFSNIVSGGILSNSDMIDKVSDVNDQGGETTLDFTPGPDATYNVPLAGASYDINVFAEIVYDYETYAAVPKVCFKEDLSDPTVCGVDEIKTVYSSGAPIQVLSAQEKRAGTGKIAVEFRIQNSGSGKVAIPEHEFDSRYDQLAFSISDADTWECKSGGRVNEARLDSSGEAVIICKLKTEMPEDTLYTKELDLTLKYQYKELIQESVRVKQQ